MNVKPLTKAIKSGTSSVCYTMLQSVYYKPSHSIQNISITDVSPTAYVELSDVYTFVASRSWQPHILHANSYQ